MYRENLITSLYEATLLILKVIKQQVHYDDFVKEYDNFYYYEALDAHEANQKQKQIMEEFNDVIKLHENIQIQIINLLYFEDNQQKEYKKVGRINSEEAMKRMNNIAKDYDIENIVEFLRNSK